MNKPSVVYNPLGAKLELDYVADTTGNQTCPDRGTKRCPGRLVRGGKGGTFLYVFVPRERHWNGAVPRSGHDKVIRSGHDKVIIYNQINSTNKTSKCIMLNIKNIYSVENPHLPKFFQLGNITMVPLVI